MEYAIKGDLIILNDDTKTFNPEATLTSGQVFRFGNENGTWYIKSGRDIAKISSITPQKYEIWSTNPNFFVNYFDFFTNYDKILTGLNNFTELKESLQYGQGIRMLRQPLVEVIISFIISANNNIPRIRKSVEGICEQFGDELDWGYAFPTLEQLSRASVDDFIKLGCGYRAEYLVKTIDTLTHSNFLETLTSLDTQDARAKLRELCGVGPKVADCILLFGLGRRDVFPVDTWIAKIYHDDYHGSVKNRQKIADFFVQKYGDLSGYAQQFLYYYKRKDIKLI